MPTISTASSYIIKINQNFPVAGQDNDSQGFRDNFKNIKLALNSTDEAIETLKLNAVAVSNTATNFNNNLIEKVVLKDHALKIIDKTTSIFNNEPLNYSDGNYQKILLGSADYFITVINWPTDNTYGKLTVDVQTTDSCTLNFLPESTGQIFNFSANSFPLNLKSNKKYVFQLWTVDNNLYVERIFSPDDIETTSTSFFDSITIGSNTYSTGSNFSTVVTNGSSYANLALLPNVITALITNDPVDSPSIPNSTNLSISSVKGIVIGATVVSTVTNNLYTVNNITTETNVITLTPSFSTEDPTEFPYNNGNNTISFTNPKFTNIPTLMTLTADEPLAVTGSGKDVKGQIYANANSLWVAYDNYSGSQNWFKMATMASTTSLTDKSTALTSSDWVHRLLPYGSIIMWYGDTTNIPEGWALCDGTNSTPNLIDRFVVGAGSTYTAGTTGGSANAIVVSHTHTGSSNTTGSHSHFGTTIVNGAHQHTFNSGVDNGTAGPEGGSGGTNYTHVTNQQGDHSHTFTTDPEGSHSHTFTTDSTGSSGTNANLPPYYALCYIMKITGGE